MSYVGIFGSTFVTIFVCAIAKPIYESMYEDIFLKIGANKNVWEVYKYYSLAKSLIKLDLVLNCEFMLTVFFLMYYDLTTYVYLGVDVFASLLMLFCAIYGHLIVN